ncbi:LZTS2 family protein [Megaselia abdita]
MDSSTPQKAEQQRGHIRSASLENNNSFILKNTLGLPLVHQPYQPGMTGTLKSRNEQKRLRQKFGSHSNLVDDYIAQSKTKFQNLRNMFEGRNSTAATPLTTQNDLYLHNNHHHHQQQTQQHHHQQQHAQAQIPSHKKSEFHEGNNVANGNLNIVENGSASQMHFDEGKHIIRPIAFKPIPFEPDYSIPIRYNDMCDRYGSTPSLALNQGPHMKFGSTSDLRPGYINNLYTSTLYSRRRNSKSFKINDSMESIRHTPESDALSQISVISKQAAQASKFQHHHHQQHLHNHQEQFELTPSPSDSGVSDLEAALKDRDSELSYLRQTMEHNEKVIFKVHKDKEAFWEQETKRLRLFFDTQQKEYITKIKKMEQMLTLQAYQFKQNKLKITDNTNRLKEQYTSLKNENDILRNETNGLKLTEKAMCDRISQLEEKNRVMDKLILNLKNQLEENEWTVCQKNGEIALLKSQLKEASIEKTNRDQEILSLKTTDPLATDDDKKTADEISQLNRIIVLKDQVILALTTELGKLRKELSDLAIYQEYGEEPSGKLTRLKYKIDSLTALDLSSKPAAENELEMIVNNLKASVEKQDSSNNSPKINDLHKFVYGTALSDNIETNEDDFKSQSDEDKTENEEVMRLKDEIESMKINFDSERKQWADEKETVLNYQRQLIKIYHQMNNIELQEK